MNRDAWFPFLILIALATILALLTLYFKVEKPGNVSFNAGYDGYYYAQVARNVIRGNGLVTDIIFPVAIPKFGLVTKQPDCLHPPLQTLFLGLTFSIFGFKDWAILLPSYLFYLLTIAATFFLGLRVFGLNTAVISSLLLLLNMYLLLDIVGEGNERPLALLIFVLLLISLYSYNHRSLFKAILPGILLGFGCLTMYSFVLFLPPLCWYVYKVGGEARRRAILTCLISFGVLVLPWLIRNIVVAGNPFFTYSWGNALHGAAMSNLFIIGEKGLLGALGGIKSIISRTFAELYGWFFVTGDFMGLLFIVSIFQRVEDERLSRLRWVVYSMIILFIGRSLFYDYWHAYLIFYPFIILMGVACFFRLLDSTTGSYRFRVAAVTVLILVNLVPLNRIYRWAGGGPYYKYYYHSILKGLPSKKLLASDQPHLLSWYADRQAIALPLNEENWQMMLLMLRQNPAMLLTKEFGEWSDLTGRSTSEAFKAASAGLPDERLHFERALSWDGNILLY